MHVVEPTSFEHWRALAREFLIEKIPPAEILWQDLGTQLSLFENSPSGNKPPRISHENPVYSVPKEFLELARQIACHRSKERWALLYRLLWRIIHEQKLLLKNPVDDDVQLAYQMQKSVSRDCHKMKAFVRFRRVTRSATDSHQREGSDEQACEQHFVAWHRPDHRIVHLVAPFFKRRFPTMQWSILTPDESVHWNLDEIVFTSGVPASEAPSSDELEDLWLTYYASIFNPARIKLRAMTAELPVRHWPTLPETRIIPDLLDNASTRVQEMKQKSEGFRSTADEFLPQHASLKTLAEAAAACTACDLFKDATQTVFGSGTQEARLVLVGEQPGDREDTEGEPFVGPSGELLDEILLSAGVARDDVYITNVVKHFKFTQQGKRRLHKKPNSREIFACRPWLEAELKTIQPEGLVCLGATPAQALLGRDFRITKQRGSILKTEWCERTTATWHPAAILRMPDPQRREQMIKQMVMDIRSVG